MVASHRPRQPSGGSSSTVRRTFTQDCRSCSRGSDVSASGPSTSGSQRTAARLGGGVGSIYWYVSNKDELLDRASDHVMADVLASTEAHPMMPDPIDSLRAISVTLFEAIVERPWLGAYFMRNTDVQPNSMRIFERLGQQAMRLDLSSQDSFHAVSAIIGFVVGTAADLGQRPPPEVRNGTVTREEYAAEHLDGWRELDPEEFPFVHHILEDFASHDDAEEFRAGRDLLLAGLRLQAGR